MASADEVIESIFVKLEAEEGLASTTDALRDLWAAGDWDPQKILATLASAVEVP